MVRALRSRSMPAKPGTHPHKRTTRPTVESVQRRALQPLVLQALQFTGVRNAGIVPEPTGKLSFSFGTWCDSLTNCITCCKETWKVPCLLPTPRPVGCCLRCTKPIYRRLRSKSKSDTRRLVLVGSDFNFIINTIHRHALTSYWFWTV